MGKDFKLEQIPSYSKSSEVAQLVYELVNKWPFLDQKTIGIQVIRSLDSTPAKIAEGFGRYHKKDKIKFFYNARASVFESIHWIKTAYERKLLSQKSFDQIIKKLQDLPKSINYLIKSTNNNLTI